MPRSLGNVRWGRVKELDGRKKIGSKGWEDYPKRLKLLSTFRYLHKLGPHKAVRKQARKLGVSPTSNMKVSQMIQAARKMGGSISPNYKG